MKRKKFWVEASWNVMAHAQKPDFFFRRNGRVHLNRRGRQFSRLLAAELCASAVVMLDTPCSEVVWRILATHSIRQFPLHLFSCASPCAITFQLGSNRKWFRWHAATPSPLSQARLTRSGLIQNSRRLLYELPSNSRTAISAATWCYLFKNVVLFCCVSFQSISLMSVQHRTFLTSLSNTALTPRLFDNDRNMQLCQIKNSSFVLCTSCDLLFEYFSLMTPPQPAKFRAPFIVTTVGRSMRRHGNWQPAVNRRHLSLSDMESLKLWIGPGSTKQLSHTQEVLFVRGLRAAAHKGVKLYFFYVDWNRAVEKG
jgi:hypothetical protein